MQRFAQEDLLPLHGATRHCCENAVGRPGRARSVEVPMLFFAQSVHGIEPRGAARGRIARQQRDDSEQGDGSRDC